MSGYIHAVIGAKRQGVDAVKVTAAQIGREDQVAAGWVDFGDETVARDLVVDQGRLKGSAGGGETAVAGGARDVGVPGGIDGDSHVGDGRLRHVEVGGCLAEVSRIHQGGTRGIELGNKGREGEWRG